MYRYVSLDLKTKVARLRSQIDDLRYRYHVQNDPEVTDKMYDGLMVELHRLEEQHPELVTSDSPTRRVAGKPLEKFEKVRHTVPQWSFNDAFDEAGVREWEERILKLLNKELGRRPADLSYVCELKIDGLHTVLTYVKGKLQVAATRGDGEVGEDVTQNIKTIHSVPLTLTEPVAMVVEGEVWMSGKMLKRVNAEREKAGESLYANPRNLAAGTIRQLDPKVVAARKLTLTAYDISGGAIPATQAEELERLKALGFKTDPHWRWCGTLAEAVKFWREWEKKKNSQPFWIDGIVIKVNQKKYQDALGYTGKAPRWALALKFSAEQGTTRIKDIYVQVGRTGALTPVALMEPVKLAGTTVTHATLHNFDEIKRLDVRIGDTVVVQKAGDIIPQVVRVLEKLRTGREKLVRELKRCPMCKSPVERREIGERGNVSAALFCTSPRCYGKQLERLAHFVGKGAFDIDGLGEKIAAQLVNEGLIKDAADIFTLTQEDLAPLERFAEKSAENLVTAVKQSREITLPRFLFALGIEQVGEETAIRLANHFTSLDKLRRASFEELQAVPDVGPRVAASIREFFDNKENQKLIAKLKNNGVKITYHASRITYHKFAGKTFVLTGTLSSLTRDQAKDKIRSLGGEVSESVSKNTDYVVVGENPGSKFDKAKQLGVRTLGEKKFVALVGG